MRHVEVLGFECPACRKTFQRIETLAAELGVPILLEKVGDPTRIAAYRVLAVPGVAVDGVLVHSGGVPDRKRIVAGEDPADLFEELHREANQVFGHYNLEYELGMMLKGGNQE